MSNKKGILSYKFAKDLYVINSKLNPINIKFYNKMCIV